MAFHDELAERFINSVLRDSTNKNDRVDYDVYNGLGSLIEKEVNGRLSVSRECVRFALRRALNNEVLQLFTNLNRIDPSKTVNEIARCISDDLCGDNPSVRASDGRSFCDMLEDWFSEPEKTAYKDWHKTCCTEIIQPAMELYYRSVKDKETKSFVYYGKVQKVLNMTMKFLYCMKEADQYENCFKDCHMPLDSKMLAWVKKAYRKENACGKEGGEKLPSITKWIFGKKGYTWSYMTQEQYKEFRDWIQKYVSTHSVKLSKQIQTDTGITIPSAELTPLLWEFAFWER